MTDKKDAEYWADWLVDAVATSTQDRRFLRGDPECDEVACICIEINGLKAIQNSITDLEAENKRLREALELYFLTGGGSPEAHTKFVRAARAALASVTKGE